MPSFARTATGRLLLTAVLSLALAGASVSCAALASAGISRHTPTASQAATATGHAATGTAVVVKVRTRAHFGRILVTLRGRALYYKPRGSCTAACLSIWPRLVMPAGKTKPLGARCLGTARIGTAGRLQVTYHRHRLYTFADDTGTSVTGNNVDGFKVAKVISCG
ncbi:MAG TPA: hypothetical protein VEV61_11475 [Streptosporangiaceae bacterium]|nr:hypothetical protein [Streptosporangiaceae bacterium]